MKLNRNKNWLSIQCFSFSSYSDAWQWWRTDEHFLAGSEIQYPALIATLYHQAYLSLLLTLDCQRVKTYQSFEMKMMV